MTQETREILRAILAVLKDGYQTEAQKCAVTFIKAYLGEPEPAPMPEPTVIDEWYEVIAKLRDALAEGTRVYADYGGRPDYAIEAIEAANAMLAGTKWGKP